MTNGNRNKEDRVILLHLSLPSIECYVCLRGRQFGICEDVRTLVKEKRVGAGMAERHNGGLSVALRYSTARIGTMAQRRNLGGYYPAISTQTGKDQGEETR
ncbi:hypothetical protein OUZ56_002042 [Daphnia magna]|uniref:Uncharacterized protein n=1 Tax=Daphnia magna TaxID=35525 RepID=A0ABR0A4I2_9CRUS|nr:hypothetical protein OUZ56_002042 [Daphnia magna]